LYAPLSILSAMYTATKYTKLPFSFYEEENVLLAAKNLLGKIIITRLGGVETAVRIVETEAYDGPADRASHAYNGRRSAKNETMYAAAGTAYVYICYGIHHLLNVITNAVDIPHAVLIRAGEPLWGISEMLVRRNASKLIPALTKGPGSVAKALGVSKQYDAYSLLGDEIFIVEDDYTLLEQEIGTSKRIGVESAGEAADFLYRFYIKGNKYVSGKPR